MTKFRTRLYLPSDLQEIITLFRDAVRTINAQDLSLIHS